MPKLPLISGLRAVKALERLGFIRQRQKGSHLVLRRDGTVCVVPMHREIDPGTLRGVLRQAGIDLETFRQNL